MREDSTSDEIKTVVHALYGMMGTAALFVILIAAIIWVYG